MSIVTGSGQYAQPGTLSVFRKNLGIVSDSITLDRVARDLVNGTFAAYTTRARDLYDIALQSGPKGSKTSAWKAYRAHKKSALAVTFGGEFDGRRRTERLKRASGLVFTETDCDDPAVTIKALKVDPSVRLFYISSSGNGVHIVWEVDPVPRTAAEYKIAYAACVNRMAALGIAVNNDPNCKDITHMAFPLR